jgi:putative membrane protein
VSPPRVSLAGGIAVLACAWLVAWADYGMTGHMAAHMAAVSVAAPLLAIGLAGSPFDPAARWPSVVAPLAMSLVELAVVWGWHLPAARAWVGANAAGLVLEQAMFVTAGLLLWSACLGTLDAESSERRAAGVAAMLLTTMHMTLLGVLVTLAPRTLFATTGFTCLGVTVDPMADQQLGGVVMLFTGGVSYLAGGLFLLSRLLRPEVAAPWRNGEAGRAAASREPRVQPWS